MKKPNIIINAYIAGKITKEKVILALERVRKALRDDVINKAIEVLECEFKAE
jgi:hypothetical protein